MVKGLKNHIYAIGGTTKILRNLDRDINKIKKSINT